MSDIHGNVERNLVTGEAHQLLRSPEQVAFELPIAGPTSRILAYGLDLLLLGTLELMLLLFLLFATSGADWLVAQLRDLPDPRTSNPQEILESGVVLYLVAIVLVVQLAVEWVYFVGFELVTNGRSPGKIWVGLRVLRDGGEPIDLRASLLRNLLRAVDLLPANYLVGLISMVLSPEGKRLGDLAAGTIVVRLDRPSRAIPAGGEVDVTEPSFRFDRGQLSRLGPDERALLRQTLRRVDEIDREAAAQAIARTADVLCRRIEHPPVAVAEQRAFLRALQRAAR